jgi:hypothetical protein
MSSTLMSSIYSSMCRVNIFTYKLIPRPDGWIKIKSASSLLIPTITRYLHIIVPRSSPETLLTKYKGLAAYLMSTGAIFWPGQATVAASHYAIPGFSGRGIYIQINMFIVYLNNVSINLLKSTFHFAMHPTIQFRLTLTTTKSTFLLWHLNSS